MFDHSPSGRCRRIPVGSALQNSPTEIASVHLVRRSGSQQRDFAARVVKSDLLGMCTSIYRQRGGDAQRAFNGDSRCG